MVTTKVAQERTVLSEGYMDVPAPQHQAGQCCASIREVLSLIGDKWSVLIVNILSQEAVRFNELRRRIDGISQRMLTRTLRELERDGLVLRTVTPTTPPSVEYALTPLGHTLLVPVSGLVNWSLANYGDIAKARQRFDKNTKKE